MNHHKSLQAHKGRGAIGCIFFILITLAVIYGAFQYTRPYIKHSIMKSKIESVAQWALENSYYDDSLVIKGVLTAANELSIDISPEDIQLERTKERVNIFVSWEDEINLPSYHKHLEFEVEAIKKAKK